MASKAIYLVDVATKDIIKDVPISDVSFVGTSSEDSKVHTLRAFCMTLIIQVISFFENNKKARLITCNTFRVAKVRSHVICAQIF